MLISSTARLIKILIIFAPCMYKRLMCLIILLFKIKYFMICHQNQKDFEAHHTHSFLKSNVMKRLAGNL
jgi:hypothetical protein